MSSLHAPIRATGCRGADRRIPGVPVSEEADDEHRGEQRGPMPVTSSARAREDEQRAADRQASGPHMGASVTWSAALSRRGRPRGTRPPAADELASRSSRSVEVADVADPVNIRLTLAEAPMPMPLLVYRSGLRQHAVAGAPGGVLAVPFFFRRAIGDGWHRIRGDQGAGAARPRAARSHHRSLTGRRCDPASFRDPRLRLPSRRHPVPPGPGRPRPTTGPAFTDGGLVHPPRGRWPDRRARARSGSSSPPIRGAVPSSGPSRSAHLVPVRVVLLAAQGSGAAAPSISSRERSTPGCGSRTPAPTTSSSRAAGRS